MAPLAQVPPAVVGSAPRVVMFRRQIQQLWHFLPFCSVQLWLLVWLHGTCLSVTVCQERLAVHMCKPSPVRDGCLGPELWLHCMGCSVAACCCITPLAGAGALEVAQGLSRGFSSGGKKTEKGTRDRGPHGEGHTVPVGM